MYCSQVQLLNTSSNATCFSSLEGKYYSAVFDCNTSFAFSTTQHIMMNQNTLKKLNQQEDLVTQYPGLLLPCPKQHYVNCFSNGGIRSSWGTNLKFNVLLRWPSVLKKLNRILYINYTHVYTVLKVTSLCTGVKLHKLLYFVVPYRCVNINNLVVLPSTTAFYLFS
jgi:hypothetical protein